MKELSQDSSEAIASYESGSGTRESLELELKDAWTSALQNDRTQIAELLGVKKETLSADQLPFKVVSSRSGVGVVEILILVGAGFLEEGAKDLGGEAYNKLKAVWNRYFDKKVGSKSKGLLGKRQK